MLRLDIALWIGWYISHSSCLFSYLCMMLSKNPNTHKSLFSITPALYTLPAIAHNISKYCTIIQHAHFFCNSNFENTYDSSILFYFGTGSTGAPVESQPHLRLTMSDNPLSVALPPSLPTTACFTKTGCCRRGGRKSNGKRVVCHGELKVSLRDRKSVV